MRLHGVVRDAHERPGQRDVVVARELLVEAGRRLSSVEMWPLTSTTPSDGLMMPASTSSSVLLPAPLGPMTPTDSPRRTVKWRSGAPRSAGRRSPRAGACCRSWCAAWSCFVNRRLYWTPRSWTASAAWGRRRGSSPPPPPARRASCPRSRRLLGCLMQHALGRHRTFANAGSSRLNDDGAQDQEHQRRWPRRRRAPVRSRSPPGSRGRQSRPAGRRHPIDGRAVRLRAGWRRGCRAGCVKPTSPIARWRRGTPARFGLERPQDGRH